MICETAFDVFVRLMALASFLEISVTEWPLYKAMAASIMVGVGQYRPFSQTEESMVIPSENDKTALMTSGKLATLLLIGKIVLSNSGVAETNKKSTIAFVDIITGAII